MKRVLSKHSFWIPPWLLVSEEEFGWTFQPVNFPLGDKVL